MKYFWIALAFLLVPLGFARGDAAPHFFIDQHFPAMRFDNLTDYPQFDFYLLYAHGSGNPYASLHCTRIRAGETITQFEGKGRKGGARLLAVPHGRNPPSVANDRIWFEPASPDYLRSDPLDGTHLGEDHLIFYRVEVNKDKLEVKIHKMETQPIKEMVVWSKSLLCLAVPIGFCLASAWLGIRFVRRLFSTQSNAAPVPQTPKTD